MASELRLTGVDELLAELERLAPELAAEARTRQDTIAQQTADVLRSAYPVVSGELRDSIEVTRESSHSAVRVFTRIEVTARHAMFYEFGTHNTPAHPTFTPIVRRGREAFLDAIVARVEARGLEVSGNRG
jgi:HK97 gp10 family phage protein